MNTIKGMQKDIASKEWGVNNVKIIPLIIYIFVETVPLVIDKFKS